MGWPVPRARTRSASVVQVQESGQRDRGRGVFRALLGPSDQPRLAGVRRKGRRHRSGGDSATDGSTSMRTVRAHGRTTRSGASSWPSPSSGRSRTGFPSPGTGLRRRSAGRDTTSELGSDGGYGHRYLIACAEPSSRSPGQPVGSIFRAATAIRCPLRPRVGQGIFRTVVADVYGRQCAVTREKAFPALEAAHIRPFKEEPRHCWRSTLPSSWKRPTTASERPDPRECGRPACVRWNYFPQSLGKLPQVIEIDQLLKVGQNSLRQSTVSNKQSELDVVIPSCECEVC